MERIISDQERELWRSFFVMRRQLELTLERRLSADAGISSADFEILVSLSEGPAEGLRAGHIGDIIGWEKSRVSHQITRMEQRGLVRREECGDDARGVWIMLTAEGSSAVRAASGDHSQALREHFFDVLDDDEKRALGIISGKLLGAMNPSICEDQRADA
ncbi:MarR family winged helix-turn-helix transcriptional regulator [Salinibacterium sp. G-O1]|uniref:MarR family winged helix-turn-helix transcriptional regulator n=1 Tax=Salinibacterium sp. G-O1 TaxID=3046208 RepID=UPI0024B9C7F6|nr:MarR family winged helix-turn-helix transcriptional regulator [Salinibacterium sp. G-O1]MDJ0333623.1 MarR family winged helix-turn-helix transcriptional regulator [Salinibacterium sp. G-O1]